MNLLFLTLSKIESLAPRGIYTDLLRKFVIEGHNVFVVSPVERKEKAKTGLYSNDNIQLLKVWTFNVKKSNILEKGIGTLAIEYQYLNAIKKYFSKVKFDLVLYSTPPITFSKVIRYIKNRDNAYSYLLLKDIFPQNAVDLGMLKKGSLLHRFFTRKERLLYKISDTIGCMSKANKDYLFLKNPDLNPNKIEINPNTIQPLNINQSELEKEKIKIKFKLPLNKKIFIYGGNLGKPQGVNFLLQTINETYSSKVFFLIVGSGTEFYKIDNWFRKQRPDNAILLQGLSKNDYDFLLNACDVGLIFLNKNFTIPNFPSRLLSYLEMRKPIIAATDPYSDIGDVIEKAECGFKVLWGNSNQMEAAIKKFEDDDLVRRMGENSWKLLQNNYLVERSYDLIVDKLKEQT